MDAATKDLEAVALYWMCVATGIVHGGSNGTNSSCSNNEVIAPYPCISGVMMQEGIEVLQKFYLQENPNGNLFMRFLQFNLCLAPTPKKKT